MSVVVVRIRVVIYEHNVTLSVRRASEARLKLYVPYLRTSLPAP